MMRDSNVNKGALRCYSTWTICGTTQNILFHLNCNFHFSLSMCTAQEHSVHEEDVRTFTQATAVPSAASVHEEDVRTFTQATAVHSASSIHEGDVRTFTQATAVHSAASVHEGDVHTFTEAPAVHSAASVHPEAVSCCSCLVSA
jgi:hypothetical protein